MPTHKLTDEQRQAIREDVRTTRLVAAEYGISPRQVKRIRQGVSGNGYTISPEGREKISAACIEGLRRYWDGPRGQHRRLPPMTGRQRYLYRLVREQVSREEALRQVLA